MKHNWEKSLEVILHHEGGYVNHPKDPGGETNLGVTKRVYEDWGGTKDMKDLEVEDVAPIYKKEYWDRCKCDDLESGVDWAVFDWAVMHFRFQFLFRINDDVYADLNSIVRSLHRKRFDGIHLSLIHI